MLGIESSCDETAAAVLDARRARAGGGGAEPGARARALSAAWCRRSPRARIWRTCRSWSRGVMARAGLGFADLGGVAASAGPGLIGGLIVGSQFAKGIAIAHGLPFVAVNHLEAHALTARLPGLVEGGAAFPYLLLLVSGGHCQCVAVEGVGPLRAARRHGGRRRRRGVRQGGEAARAGLARRAGAGEAGGDGRCRALCLPAAAAGAAGLRFQFLRAEDRGGADGGAAWPPGALPAPDGGGYRRQLPARGGRGAGGPRGARDGDDARAQRRMARLLVVAGGVAANGASGRRWRRRRRRRASPASRRRCGCAPTTR